MGAIARFILRVLFALPRRLAQPRLHQAGFILPTVVLLLLVVTLTVGSITLRTFTRTSQAIGDRQQQVIYNAATPAIDRAKAKLEYLFTQDERLPSGVPGEKQLFGMMANDAQPRGGLTVAELLAPLADGTEVNPYEFEDETVIDLDGNPATNDNAWQFPVDSDGDGEPDAVIAYSMIFQTPDDINELSDASQVDERAQELQVRSGPLSSTAASSSTCANRAAGAVEEGWFRPNTAVTTLSKNFQVNAIAIPGAVTENGTLNAADAIGTVATLEFQQDRQINQGNKWGAWFRNDLEVFPGPQFRWNGAMHTEGNFIIGQGNRGDASRPFRAFLISSINSCLNNFPGDSEITLGEPEPAENEGVDFQGQVISGRVVDADFSQSSLVHVFAENPITNAVLDEESDSLTDAAPPESDFALDPIRLLTEGISVSRNVDDVAPVRNPAWDVDDENPEIEGRILNESQPLPRVGDSYRADNRFGPQPRYSDPNALGGVREVDDVGAPIPAGDSLIELGGPGDIEIGLDGYWERRARNEGMRVVVGQRLELGDPYGWDGVSESLYPFQECTANNAGDCHKARQRRTLSDNLAAVQATAVYHASSTGNDGDIPRMCLATTVHPGTAKTLQDSATFEALQIPEAISGIAETTILTDFFTGRGTNGWEFVFPYTASAYPSAIGSGEALGIALRNLSQFAGDPSGGAPSFPPVQDGVVHPLPLMSMWGDFSRQRRILELLDGGTPYASLSPADKTMLHTATCTLSMLAYNINYLNQFNPDPATNAEYGATGSVETGAITALANQLVAIANNTGLPPEVTPQAAGAAPEAFITSLEQWNAVDPGAVTNNMLAIARVITNKEQVNRDRTDGFRTAGTYTCTVATPGLDNLCPDPNVPKYPILHVLFPRADVVGITEAAGETRDGATLNAYIASENVAPYEPVSTVFDPALGPVIGPLNNFVATDIVGIPRLSPTDGWEIPIDATAFDTAAAGSDPVNPNSNEVALIRCIDEACGPGETGSQTWHVPFKDAALFDGRERMGVRVLDVDIDLLRNASLPDDAGARWLPLSGIVYAFREDAVREDAIVRPAALGAVTCDNYTTLEANLATCQTDAQGNAVTTSTDPLLLDGGFSMKAVDYVADPDRRVDGFRLVDGVTLKRNGDLGIGMSFISDNSVYIKGDFNLHQTPAGVALEEFTDLLADDWANFYDRANPNNDFANPAADDWRPTEVLADAVTILSSQFCDGSIEDTFTTAGTNNTATLGADVMDSYGCATGNHTSYLNQNRPRSAEDWLRQNPDDLNSPVVVDRNGNPVTTTDPFYGGDYFAQEENSLSPAVPQTVNFSLIGGIIPSRFNQPYGGLHNFPRLIEDWDDVALEMSGTFFQLNFSTAATAPYDQEVWEPGEIPTEFRDRFPYYNPPDRLWGYDVALQYVPAAPIASRFASPSNTRSEFYSEPTLDDPYIAQLCRQVAGDDSFCPAAN